MDYFYWGGKNKQNKTDFWGPRNIALAQMRVLMISTVLFSQLMFLFTVLVNVKYANNR